MSENFYNSWQYLCSHEMFCDFKYGLTNFPELLDIFVTKVNPETNTVNMDKDKNTKVEIWLESGPYYEEEGEFMHSHDTDLDCGGDTFEEAIINLAELVKEYYPPIKKKRIKKLKKT